MEWVFKTVFFHIILNSDLKTGCSDAIRSFWEPYGDLVLLLNPIYKFSDSNAKHTLTQLLI